VINETAAQRTSALAPALAGATAIALITTVIWAVSGGGYFWPAWVILGCASFVAPFAWWHALGGLPLSLPRTRVLWVTNVLGALIVVQLLVWAFVGARGTWVFWPVFALLLLAAGYAAVDLREHLPFMQTRTLQARVDTLSRTRRGALDVQAAELRRIERDLHDGAQARLIALSMQLGRAENKVADRPEAAELIHSAIGELNTAVAELRDLARGIAPPVLADRGLVAAIETLAERSGALLQASGSEADRLPPAIESAAYFIIGEALANAGKHAPGAAVTVRIDRDRTTLRIDVLDDGPGGADPSGHGLSGLRARAEALDGTFTVSSPAGGPTRIKAELPCES